MLWLGGGEARQDRGNTGLMLGEGDGEGEGVVFPFTTFSGELLLPHAPKIKSIETKVKCFMVFSTAYDLEKLLRTGVKCKACTNFSHA